MQHVYYMDSTTQSGLVTSFQALTGHAGWWLQDGRLRPHPWSPVVTTPDVNRPTVASHPA